MDKNQIEKQIKDYFKTISESDPAGDENLFEAGILDSFGVVEFLTFLEEVFHLELEPEDIEIQNFATLSAIIAFVEQRKKENL